MTTWDSYNNYTSSIENGREKDLGISAVFFRRYESMERKV